MPGETAKADPNEGLASDATLATEIVDATARTAEQLSYFGGDPIEDEVISGDRGDSLDAEPAEEEEDRGDEAEEEADGDEAEESDESEDESTDDGSEEGVDDSDGDELDEEKPKSEDKGIPRHRFNEVNERMKRAEQRLVELEKTSKAQEEGAVEKYDFDKNEEAYMELLLDGKTKEAAVLRREIRAAEKEDFKAETKRETISETSATKTQELVDSLAAQAEQMYPVLLEGHADYNPAIVNKVMTFMAGYRAAGLNADDALVAGLADAIQIYDLDTKYGATETEDKGDAVTKKTVTKKEPIKKVKEKLALQKQQGKSPAGEGKGSADAGAVVPDITQMSDEEMDALPSEMLARLRGDFG